MKDLKGTILAVDDDLSALKLIRHELVHHGYHVISAISAAEALEKLERELVDVIVADYYMPEMDGIELTERVRAIHEDIPIIINTAANQASIAVEAMKKGAFEYITKPWERDELRLIVERALEQKRLVEENKMLVSQLEEKYRFDNIVGSSAQMMEVYEIMMRAAKVDSTVLVTGESGTGKELVAKALHYNSPRKKGPFVELNCAALPEHLLESELFGIEKNVATNVDERKGKFELADGGTIFLDEIGDMTLVTQAKVLRILQERKVERVGSRELKEVDIRLIAATNSDLKKNIKEKKFREDLYYRLNVIVLPIPPLRERKDDIPLLEEHFMRLYCEKNGFEKKSLSPETSELMMSYDWPGNVRELENCIERCVVMSRDSLIGPEDLPRSITSERDPLRRLPDNVTSLPQTIAAIEKQLIINTLKKAGWSETKAAHALGISDRSMWYKVKKHGIKKEYK